ncbi:MAG: ABC transporter permease [Gammaproteobacteria bacterium]|nr:ABC transporter permease [Gammaproteobacteria bacterium]
MKSPAVAIAFYTFQEALRNRLFVLTLVGLVCLLGVTEFIGELAVTETAAIQALIVGSGMRLFAVCTVSLFVITSTVREFNDKGFELLLSLPIPRYSYFLGKFAGFMLLAFVIAVAAAILLLLYSNVAVVSLWLVSLVSELAIMIALSLLLLLTFSNITVSFMLALAFYLLSRSLSAIQLIAHSPILESDTLSQAFMNRLVDAIAFLMPELHRFTRSDWLVHGASWQDLGVVGVQTLIYVVLLSAAGLFDLYRKDL